MKKTLRPARSLHFPENQSVGIITIVPKVSEWKALLSNSKPLDELEARGTMVVDEGASVTLKVIGESSKNLSWLDRLAPEDIQSLDLDDTAIDDDQLKYLVNLRQLESLKLTNTAVTDDGLATLKKSDQLVQVGNACHQYNRQGYGPSS